MRFHVCALPHTNTTTKFIACAYTAKVINFCKMMKNLGHTVYLYGGEKNEAPCDEHIVVVKEHERAAHVSGKHFTEASFDSNTPLWQAANKRTAEAIKERAQPKDFICVIGGIAQMPIAAELPNMITVEFGIGYGGVFSKYRVFESYAWMHMVYGAQSGGNPHRSDGNWWDEVIPGYLDPSQFPFSDEKEDYYLYVGRIIDRKGYNIAVEVANFIGKPLIMCGQGDAPPGVIHKGVVGPEERGFLMSKAKALFVPTQYVEPFANVHIEAQACGTPVITTDWGVFTETVINGFNGYRCRSFGEFCQAAIHAETLDHHAIRKSAIANYGIETIGKRYEQYFERLLTLWGNGWYS